MLESDRYCTLLYPAEKSLVSHSGITEDDAKELELDSLLPVRQSSFGELFTDDENIIKYRQNTFSDLEKYPGITKVLQKMLPYISDISDARKIAVSGTSVSDGYLYSISEIEIYVSLMDMLKEELAPFRDKVESPALREFCKRITDVTEDDAFEKLKARLDSLASRVRDIKSITVGINLDRRMCPDAMGIVSVNSEQYKSGDFFDKMKRLSFKNDSFTFMAELMPYGKDESENQKLAMTNAISNAIGEVFKSSVKSWKNTVEDYISESTDFFMSLIPEVEFVCEGVELVNKLKKRGVKLSYPEICSDGSFEARGICNPVIALKTEGELTPNDIEFNQNGRIFVITGPNRGGKSVLTCAVGHAFYMAQMGLPVAAEYAKISPCDTILTHFPTGSEDTVEKGRLGEECARLCAMFDRVTDKSVVLLDESLSSTGSFEGAYIAAEVLRGFAAAGCRGIFSTHLHDLAASVAKINAEGAGVEGVSKIDNMVAEIDGGKRTFRIVRKNPDGKSYAKDVAEKYGLSLDLIMKKINREKN